MTSTMRPEDLLDNTVIDSEGGRIGKVGSVYLADDTHEPEWVSVRTGMFGGKESFVPLLGADMREDGLRVDVHKDKVSDAPRLDADGHLSPDQSAELYRYYGMPLPRSAKETGNAAQDGQAQGRHRDTSRDQRGQAGEGMVRSEERLDVGTETVETGRVRLRKYVVTEDRQVTVPVSREEVRLEREPIRDRRTGGEIGDAEQELVLREERAVVNKETVPVEEVRLVKETVTDQQAVSGQVRKEQIDVEDGREEPRR